MTAKSLVVKVEYKGKATISQYYIWKALKKTYPNLKFRVENLCTGNSSENTDFEKEGE